VIDAHRTALLARARLPGRVPVVARRDQVRLTL
jgi:hypothetical protein